MIQGHTIDTVLDTSLRHGLAFQVWSWPRLFTATAFLLASGLAFHTAVLAGPPSTRSPAARSRRLRRAVTLVCLGYLIRFPLFAVIDPGSPAAAAAWAELAACDILQCFGYTLAGLELIAYLAPRPTAAALMVTLAAYLLCPLLDGIGASGLWRPLANLFTTRGGSFFPLVPFAGHLFAGVVLGGVVLPQGAATERSLTCRRLGVVGVSLLALATVVVTLESGWVDPAVSPGQILTKLSVAVLFAAALAFLTRNLRRLPPQLEALAGRTLTLYVVHCAIVYGKNFGLAARFGPHLGVGASILCAAATLVTSVAVTMGWHSRFQGGLARR